MFECNSISFPKYAFFLISHHDDDDENIDNLLKRYFLIFI
jgi:hypothetical protein